MAEAEATCRRELELEIPAEDVTKATERVAKELALYPDNWEVYRDKWFSAGAFEIKNPS